MPTELSEDTDLIPAHQELYETYEWKKPFPPVTKSQKRPKRLITFQSVAKRLTAVPSSSLGLTLDNENEDKGRY